MKPRKKRAKALQKKKNTPKRRPQPAGQKMQLPVQENREMIGWPGTMPPSRMRTMIEAIETGRDPQGEQILTDLGMLVQAQNCLKFSAEIPEETQAPIPSTLGRKEQSLLNLKRLTIAAWTQDTVSTIGGVMSIISIDGNSEYRTVFKLLRDPEWIGFNRMLPLLKGLNATISESREMPSRPGIVSAEPAEDGFPPGTNSDFPEGEAELLAIVLKWHQVREVRWRPQHA